MATAKTEEFELEDAFEEGAEVENDEAAKAAAVKNSLTRRRVIDDLLEERRLSRRLRDYDFDLDDEK
ncbi:MAG: hypothetical protein Q8J78_07540 [Moraxellaceae bacterium]|nr:hypothetical protein [Moraxellaceae bacterium]